MLISRTFNEDGTATCVATDDDGAVLRTWTAAVADDGAVTNPAEDDTWLKAAR
jgi:hypothetical protein